MSKFLPKAVKDLIEEFSKLPGVGPKSAQRLAIHLLHSPESRVTPLGDAVLNLKKNIVFCSSCWNVTETSPCPLCASSERDKSLLCVVENILDVVALEKTREYSGLYHVLHGALSPVDGIGPEQLKLSELINRVKESDIKEIILATNPSLEGEATALYIQKNLKDFSGSITRIARGLPVGGDLEYADEVTLSRAITGRSKF